MTYSSLHSVADIDTEINVQSVKIFIIEKLRALEGHIVILLEFTDTVFMDYEPI